MVGTLLKTLGIFLLEYKLQFESDILSEITTFCNILIDMILKLTEYLFVFEDNLIAIHFYSQDIIIS